MTKLVRSLLLMVISAVLMNEVNAQTIFWKDAEISSFTISEQAKQTIVPQQFRSFRVDTVMLKGLLQNAPKEFTEEAAKKPLILAFPMPDGSTARFSIVYSPMMEPALEKQFPNIRTFSGQGIDDRTATLKMDWTDYGLHVQVLSPLENKGFYVDPYAVGEKTQYMSYSKKDLTPRSHIESGVLQEQYENISGPARRTNAGPCYGNQLRTYRLAVATTGQYAQAVGASTVSQILSSVTTTINRVNGVYETELAIRLTLVGNNSQILYLSTTTPFSQYANDNDFELIDRSQEVIDSVITSGSYDVGHTFSTAGGGIAGLAGLGVVCRFGQKASGVTGSALPLGDAYDIDFVAHELGHQFGGDHTFNASTGSCGGGNRNASTSVEPGSGVTIMGYAGICGATNDLAGNSIPYFHAVSQNQIRTYITSNAGATCGTFTNTGNTIPVVNAGTNYIIPRSTPFVLTGSATDPNNSEVLTYSWEEMDPGTSAGNWNSGSKPFFRSFNPTTSPSRYFPRLPDLLTYASTGPRIGEVLPSSAQTLNFRLTVRDNRVGGGGVCSGDVVVTVNGSTGPFNVSSQWSPAEVWNANGSNQATVSWNVAGTNASPINCANVSILLSTDGGLTYPHTLVASTPNNGSATFTIPNIKTDRARIMVKALGNIFFAINDATFTITSSCAAQGATVTPATEVTALVGSNALNLDLKPSFSNSFVPAGTITGADAFTNLAIRNTSTNGCASSSFNQFQYHTYSFRVTVSGSYSFAFSPAVSLVANLYNGSFNTNSVCSNFITSTATWPGSGNVTLNSTMTASLTAGVTYILNVGTFSSTTLPLPATYRMNITTATAGIAYVVGQQYTNPGASFAYSYVVVNNATGNIVSISNTSNLTNNSMYPAGQYTIYGLSYANSIANLNSYVSGSFNALATHIQNNPSTFCADFSDNAVTVNVTGTFPVQFTALRARKQGEKVALDWGTLTEQNNSHFVVQRSGNGSEFNNEIGNVKAVGNSNTQQNYNFLDAAPLKGWNYYRIKQVDVDGKFTYSNVAAVNFEKSGGKLVLYPNPAKDQLNLEYTTERSGKIEIQVIDSKGAVLMQQNFSVTAGRNIELVNISSLSQGMYLLKYVDADGNISFSKFIKQ